MSDTQTTPRRALIIGGSLGGLFAGTLLRKQGWDVRIFERSAHDLDSRGGGIVLRQEVVEVLRRAGADLDAIDLGVKSIHRTVLGPDGTILRREHAPQTQTSWSLIYSTMKELFGEEGYHRGMPLTAIRQDPEAKTVTATFQDGSEATGDLLIGADGHGSTVRELLWPGSEPRYAGYLAWRGLVPEAEMPALSREHLHGDFGFANVPRSHMLGYLVPGEGNDTRPGHRLYNWVWYRAAEADLLDRIMTDRTGKRRRYSLPEGALADQWRDHLAHEARAFLPPAFREIVMATEAPFAQAIRDLTVERMINGRVALIGDAAFVPRPHTAAGTSKAATNAMMLADALSARDGDIDATLLAWEPAQLALGQLLFRQGTQAGDHLLFARGRVSRVE